MHPSHHHARPLGNTSFALVADEAKKIGFLFNSSKRQLLIRDRDLKFSKNFDQILKGFNVEARTIPFRSPNLNPYAEGWVGILKRECLDHFFVFGEKHFRYLITEYVKHYNTKRPHSVIGRIPARESKKAGPNQKLRCEKELGGILQHYYWN